MTMTSMASLRLVSNKQQREFSDSRS